MLTIYCRKEPFPLLLSTGDYFAQRYKAAWFDTALVREIVADIDETLVINAGCCISPLWDEIPCTELTGEAKGLILVAMDTEGCRNFRSTIWGADSISWLVKLSSIRDFGIYLCHPLEFISGANGGSLETEAQTEDGTRLSTCKDIWDYYADTYSAEP